MKYVVEKWENERWSPDWTYSERLDAVIVPVYFRKEDAESRVEKWMKCSTIPVRIAVASI